MIVLGHGRTATRRYVVHGSRLLERSGHRVVAYDARGHGDSSPAADAREYEYTDLVGDLGGVLDELGIDRAVLVGASMGAATTLALALEQPDRVAALVQVTPAHLGLPQEDPRALERWYALADALEHEGVEGFLRAYGDPPVAERFKGLILQAIRQRIERHRHPEAVANALRVVPRSKAFDMLRTQVLQAMDQHQWQLLAITSPTPGCGKTLTAINLALSIARQADRSAEFDEPPGPATGRALEVDNAQTPVGQIAVALEVAEEVEDVRGIRGDGGLGGDRRGWARHR